MKHVIFLSIISFLFTSCATRGYKVGDQLPEYHPYYKDGRKVIFAEGAKADKIVYENYSNDGLRYTAQEEKFADVNDIQKIQTTDEYGSTRMIASDFEEEEIIFNTRRLKKLKPVQNKSRMLKMKKVSKNERSVASDGNSEAKVFYSAPKKLHKKRSSTSHLRHILYYNSNDKI